MPAARAPVAIAVAVGAPVVAPVVTGSVAAIATVAVAIAAFAVAVTAVAVAVTAATAAAAAAGPTRALTRKVPWLIALVAPVMEEGWRAYQGGYRARGLLTEQQRAVELDTHRSRTLLSHVNRIPAHLRSPPPGGPPPKRSSRARGGRATSTRHPFLPASPVTASSASRGSSNWTKAKPAGMGIVVSGG